MPGERISALRLKAHQMALFKKITVLGSSEKALPLFLVHSGSCSSEALSLYKAKASPEIEAERKIIHWSMKPGTG